MADDAKQSFIGRLAFSKDNVPFAIVAEVCDSTERSEVQSALSVASESVT